MQREHAPLIRRAVAGDSAAFEELIRGEEKYIYCVILHYMGDVHEAEDCLQEVMLKVYRALSTYRSDCSFRTWVSAIASNYCKDQLRKRKNKRDVSIDEMDENGEQLPSRASSPETEYIAGESYRALLRAIDELPKDMRQTVLLREMDGLSYDEIADTTGQEIGTVRSRLNRARAKLRKFVQDNPELFGEYFVNIAERRRG